MNIEIMSNNENKLLNRKEILFSASFAGKTPTKEEAKQEICKKLNISPELTVVIKISPLFGSTESEILVHSYFDKEAMKIEQKHILERSIKKEKPKQAQAAAAPIAKEEKKEE